MPPLLKGEDSDVERTIVFFHPDLGIGGAERLVVDAAVGLQSRGFRVVIFTNHCDPSHCFDECRDGTLDVRVRGHWLIPPSFLGRLTILCAILRHIHLILHIYYSSELATLKPTTFFADQLSAGLPLLQYLLPGPPIVFYCHFPDLLLARGRENSRFKRIYRVPFDWLEEWSMGFSQAIAVNSEFTKRVVEKTWPGLTSRVSTKVVYPCVDTTPAETGANEVGAELLESIKDHKLLVSINRFERKKDIGLAIKAFAAVPPDQRVETHLVIAGGYDSRIIENVEYLQELQTLCTELSLEYHTTSDLTPPPNPSTPVLFLLSIPSALKGTLIASARLLIYTPSNEHFGIVPLESMLGGTPVLAANTGGPVETILDGETGWLRSPDDVSSWTTVIRFTLTAQPSALQKMGERGTRRVRETFARDKMAEALERLVNEAVDFKRPPPWFNAVVSLVSIVVMFALGLAAAKLIT